MNDEFKTSLKFRAVEQLSKLGDVMFCFEVHGKHHTSEALAAHFGNHDVILSVIAEHPNAGGVFGLISHDWLRRDWQFGYRVVVVDETNLDNSLDLLVLCADEAVWVAGTLSPPLCRSGPAPKAWHLPNSGYGPREELGYGDNPLGCALGPPSLPAHPTQQDPGLGRRT